jgi:large subunit ribosomal protein L24
VRKQRKYRYNSPLHLKHKFLSANLSKELRKKYGKRSSPVKKGDEVVVMRGKFAKKEGKILDVDLKKSRVTIENLNRSKADGTKVNVYFAPSNLQIKTLNLEDRKRLETQRKRIEKVEKKETKPEKKNAPEKKPSK